MLVIGSIAGQFASVFGLLALAVTIAYLALTWLHAKVELLTATIVVIACLGAHLVSRVVLRYTPPDERHR